MSLGGHTSITNLRRQYTNVRSCSDEEPWRRKSPIRSLGAGSGYDLDGAKNLRFVAYQPGSFPALGRLSRDVRHSRGATDSYTCGSASLGDPPLSGRRIFGVCLRFPLVL